VDISEGALAEARKRHTENRRSRYTADFIQGNLMIPETFTEIERVAMAHGQSSSPCFDTVAMQLALHYLIPTEDDARKFFSFVASCLKPGGKFIATFPCCDRIGRRMRNLESDNGQYFFGNRQYRVTIEPDQMAKMIPECAEKVSSPEAMEQAIEHEIDFDSVVDRLGSSWGLQYKFWLIETIDNQEEYVVPIIALERLVNELGMKVEMSANFAEILRHYEDSQTIRDFRRSFPKLPLTDDEEEVFKFYRAIVIRKDE
jgi:SAM-dependent methyltransferase